MSWMSYGLLHRHRSAAQAVTDNRATRLHLLETAERDQSTRMAQAWWAEFNVQVLLHVTGRELTPTPACWPPLGLCEHVWAEVYVPKQGRWRPIPRSYGGDLTHRKRLHTCQVTTLLLWPGYLCGVPRCP